MNDAALEHRDVLEILYRAILGRRPDATGAETYLKALTTGRTDINAIALSMIRSGEFRTKNGNLVERNVTSSNLQVYSGYTDGDLKIFSEFDVSAVRPTPGFLTEWIGSKVRISSLWKSCEKYDNTVHPKPIPLDYHAEAIEWIGTLKAVLSAKDAFAVMELGAGFGPWAVASCVAAKNKGIEKIALCAVEADPVRFKLLEQNIDDNGLLEDDVTLLQSAIGVTDGAARWPKIADPRQHSGLRPVRDGNDADEKYMDKYKNDMMDVKIVALPPLLRKREVWDLIHIDIQGTETELCTGVMDELTKRARYLVIGTHSRKIDGDLMELFLGAGWILEHEKPTRMVCDGSDLMAMTRTDGAQVWRNAKF